MNNKYRIIGNDNTLTSIDHIGLIKHKGSEWSTYTKKFNIDSIPTFAAIRFLPQGVCGVYVNGEFVGASTGRYVNRIAYSEFTSRLKLGENEIKIVLGGHYYQTFNEEMKARRGTYFSEVAAEVELDFNGKLETFGTDSTWVCESDDGQNAPQVFTQVTRNEYDRFWLSAALLPERKKIEAPEAVLTVAKGYGEYISKPKEEFAVPTEIHSTNMERDGEAFISVEKSSFIFGEFDKIRCGYFCIECEAENDGTVEVRFDFTGYPQDLEFDKTPPNSTAKFLVLKASLKKGENKLLFIRRRAAKYMHLIFNTKVKLTRFGFELELMNHENLGYFNCSEEKFNEMWEVGKYTLHINKHQDYESCPRNEMQYFSGDGIIDALIDAYAFGDGRMTISSLSYTEMRGSIGLVTDKYFRNFGLWEYPAWRIIHAYVHYVYFNDTHLVRQHFDELATNVDWMIGKMNSNYLMYQYPIYSGGYCRGNTSVDYTQSVDRLGEKPHVNALFYKSLLCMAEFADIVGDERAEEWRSLAKKVKNAINTRLWSDEKQAYLDTYKPTYIPQDGNALCLLFGIAEGERAEAVMKTLREKLWTPYGSTVGSEYDPHMFGGNDTVSPLMNTYEAAGRFLMGDGKGAMELADRCWGSMLRRGAKSFWEYANANEKERPKYFTICHAWSAGVTYLLGAFVLGIRPESAGYETIRFEPYDGLESFEGVVPTAKGLVAVNCETVDGLKKYTLALPKNSVVKTVLPEKAVVDIIEY